LVSETSPLTGGSFFVAIQIRGLRDSPINYL
jgi:hypothetical protein